MRNTLTHIKVDTLYGYIETKPSRLNILINMFARIFRLFHNAKKDVIKRTGLLSVDERDNALLSIIRIVQKNAYTTEFDYLMKLSNDPTLHQMFPSKSSILSLAPFMNKDEQIIRVGGRIHASPALSINQKHQIFIPQGNLATLIVRNLHNKHLHPGILALLSFVRENYWIIRPKTVIRKMIHDCITCFKLKLGP